jgi:ADP-ribose pyrophosphatase
MDLSTKKPILQFVAIQRRDTKEWAIPGGMRDPGELITKTLLREFSEEALNKNLKFDKNDRILDQDKNEFQKKLGQFFLNGTIVNFKRFFNFKITINMIFFIFIFFLKKIYKGYVDDPRNTGKNNLNLKQYK